MGITKPVAGNRTKIKLLTSTVSAVIAATALPATFAQEAEEITVTGSRIVRRDFESSSPILTVDSGRFEQSSTISVESVLNQLPQFQPAQTQFSAIGQIQTASDISLGVGTLNLRGINTNRSLVLIDGRRGQPANAAGVVDTNSIPSAAIERVETITGGASSVYGADAMAGVVNFVLKDNYEGASVDFQTGITEAGDAEENRLSALLGISSGNANVMLGVEWYERKTGFQKNRDFYTNAWEDPDTTRNGVGGFAYFANYSVSGAEPDPTQAAVDQAFFDDHGIVNTPGTPTYVDATQVTQYNFNRDGTIWVNLNGVGAVGFDESQAGRQPDTGDGFSGLGIGADGTVNQVYVDAPMSTPLERRSLFAKGNVDLADNLRLFAQANYSRLDVTTFSAGPPPATFGLWGGAIPNDGRAIPSSLQTLLDSRMMVDPNDPNQMVSAANETWRLQRGLDFIGNFGPRNTSDVYQILLGIEGELDFNDWTWEAFYSSGETTTTNFYGGLPSVARYKAVVEAEDFGRGIQQGSTLANNYQLRCESGLPIFDGGLDTITDDCVTSILSGSKSVTNIEQDIFEANLQGRLMDLPAGELRFAAGIAHRTNKFSYDPANSEGAIFDVPLGIFSSNPTTGSTKVGEIYGELLVPVLDNLDLELGYRYSDYDSGAGEIGTYKILAGWDVTDWVTIRGGYNLANRAPNIAELYSAEVSNFQGAGMADGDPCSVVNLTGGWGNTADNPNRAQVQNLCAALIGNTTSEFGAPGSQDANTYGDDTNVVNTGITALVSGNPDLESEEGETWTVGAVFTAPFGIEGLVGTVDWYQIEITEAITTFSGTDIYRGCFNVDGVSNPTYSINDPAGYCALIARSENGGRGNVRVSSLNTGFIETSGIDFSANYNFDLPWGDSAYVNTTASYLDYFRTQTSISAQEIDHTDTLDAGGQFKWRLNATFGYMFSDLDANVGLRMRHLPSIQHQSKATNPNSPFLDTEAYTAFDLFASYNFRGTYQIRAGIDNLFEREPALTNRTSTNNASGQTNAGFYDVLGRRFYLGLRAQF